MKTELKIILEKMDKSDLISFIGHIIRTSNSDSFWQKIEEYIPIFYDDDMFENMDFRLLVYLAMPENRHLIEPYDSGTYLVNRTLNEILNKQDLQKYVTRGDIIFED